MLNVKLPTLCTCTSLLHLFQIYDKDDELFKANIIMEVNETNDETFHPKDKMSNNENAALIHTVETKDLPVIQSPLSINNLEKSENGSLPLLNSEHNAGDEHIEVITKKD